MTHECAWGCLEDAAQAPYDGGVSLDHQNSSGRPTPARAESRGEVSARRRELQRRRRRRLYPMVLVFALIVALVGYQFARPKNSTAAGATTSTVPHATTTTTIPVANAYVPPNIAPVVSPHYAGEGVWSKRDAWAKGPAPVYFASFRPFKGEPSVYAYAAWMRNATTDVALYPGYKGPGPSKVNRGPEQVPATGRGRLLATFNSGFYEADSPAGFYTHGTLYFPMVKGDATVVQYTNGKVDVISWPGGAPPATITMARQNLHLLVSGGKPNPSVANGYLWGSTLHGVPAVWRSALGVDKHGNLIYVAAPSMTAASLAAVMVKVGAVRAMQLDINPAWPIYVTYANHGAANPTLDVPNPNQIRTRFLYYSTKDFFALYEKIPGATATPW